MTEQASGYIELTYFPDGPEGVVYQVLQFRTGEPWRIVYAGELICSMEKLEGFWYTKGKAVVPQDLINGIGRLIDAQHFNSLPVELKMHWAGYVQEAIAQGDSQYLVVCRAGIDFERFEKIFRTYITNLVRDPWEIHFKVYNAEMSDDFEVFVKGTVMVY